MPTGNSMIVDGWEIRVEKILTAETLSYEGSVEKAAGRFALLFLAVTNRGLSPNTFVAFGSLEIEDAEGRRYEEDFVASTYAMFQYNTDIGAEINPDSTAHIVAVFDILEESDSYLLVPGLLAESSEGRIVLNIPR
jgi:hypothetical protein